MGIQHEFGQVFITKRTTIKCDRDEASAKRCKLNRIQPLSKQRWLSYHQPFFFETYDMIVTAQKEVI